MIDLFLALALIIVLYWRTLPYLNLIDDIVPMSGYLYNVPQVSPAPDFYLKKSNRYARIWAITVHCLNTVMIYLILGGKAALLFAVYPVAVNNVAWITGSYYATTTFLTLTAYYFLTKTAWFIGVPLAMAFFAAALNSTVATICFPFVFLFGNPIGLSMLIPLGIFLTGKRFTTGKKIREGNGVAVPSDIAPDIFTVGRLAVMVKTVALYLFTALVPLKLLFFRKFGEEYRFDPECKKTLDSFNKWFYLSILLIGSFIGVGYFTGKLFWAFWFLVLITAFSNYRLLGQFFAERYMYPACIGVIAILSCFPEPIYWSLFGFYLLRTHLFIPVFSSNEQLYKNGIQQDPDEPINYCNLSDWYLMTVRDMPLAGYYIQMNIIKDPKDYKAEINFASFWRIMGNLDLALKHGKLAIEKAKGRAWPHTMAVIENQLKYTENAIIERDKANAKK